MAIDEQSSLKTKRLFFRTKTFRLIAMLFLTFSYFLVELIVGNLTNSVALVADAFHMLSDVISLIIAAAAVRMSKRRSDINTYGWVRAEVVGANINTVFLLALSLTIVFDAIKRYFQPEQIEKVNLLLIVGSVGLGINIIGLFLFQGFHGHSHGGSGGGSHGHTHGGSEKSHGHTHGGSEKLHGHSHEKKANHRPSHGGSGGGSHGHSHDQDGTIPKDAIELDVLELSNVDPQSEFGTKFDRHSTRALQEAIAECTHSEDNQGDTVIDMDDNGKKKSKKQASMNMHGVFLHVLADALGSIVVIISALLIKFVPHDPNDTKHWTVYIDPTLSIIIVIIISISAFPLFKETSYILLHTIPKHIEINRIKSDLLADVPEIDGIHELHVWRLTDQKIIASAHLSRKNFSNYMLVADKVKKFFHSIGIHSVTIQYEYTDDTKLIPQSPSTATTTTTIAPINQPNEQRIEGDCLLRCENDECDTQTCCTKSSDRTNIILNKTNSDVFTITQSNEF